MPNVQTRGQAATPECGRNLEIDQALDPVTASRDVAASNRSGDGLGKATDLDDTREAIEGRQPWRWRTLEIPEDVVLYNHQAGVVGQLQQPVCRDRRQGSAGRVVDA